MISLLYPALCILFLSSNIPLYSYGSFNKSFCANHISFLFNERNFLSSESESSSQMNFINLSGIVENLTALAAPIFPSKRSCKYSSIFNSHPPNHQIKIIYYLYNLSTSASYTASVCASNSTHSTKSKQSGLSCRNLLTV